jgi:hypothetical protein
VDIPVTAVEREEDGVGSWVRVVSALSMPARRNFENWRSSTALAFPLEGALWTGESAVFVLFNVRNNREEEASGSLPLELDFANGMVATN